MKCLSQTKIDLGDLVEAVIASVIVAVRAMAVVSLNDTTCLKLVASKTISHDDENNFIFVIQPSGDTIKFVNAPQVE